jgi:threonyl-tRNA synthetase
LYARELRSYRDLPIKYAEFSTLHRNEVKGALGGLTRVRALTQDDAHAFVRTDQIESEVSIVAHQIDALMKVYGLTYKVRLSLRDPEDMKAYLGDAKIWDHAEGLLEDLAKKLKMDYHTAVGEAAFYGPKMDFMAVDAIGREHQLSTIQLDFNQPERFDLGYIDEKGDKQRPVMIHRALNGTFERMLGILIEHYAGNFPVWLAPEQVRLATVNNTDEVLRKAEDWHKQLKEAGIRHHVDYSGESVGRKMRYSILAKIPYTVVIGEKEVEGDTVMPRIRPDLSAEAQQVVEPPGKNVSKPFNVKELKFDKFVEQLKREVASRAGKSSL